MSAHFEKGRSCEHLECHHRGHGISGKPEYRFITYQPKGNRMTGSYPNSPEFHIYAVFLQNVFNKIIHPYRHTTGDEEHIPFQPFFYLLSQTLLIIAGNTKEMRDTTGLNNLGRNRISIAVRYLILSNLLIEVSKFITSGKHHYLRPPVHRNYRFAYHCHYAYVCGPENTPLAEDFITLFDILTLMPNILAAFPSIKNINAVTLAPGILDTHHSVRTIRHRRTCHDTYGLAFVDRFVRHYAGTDISDYAELNTAFL